LSKSALKRLKKLKLDDSAESFSLRLEGDSRIFGIREFNSFFVLWYDEHHQVCPQKLLLQVHEAGGRR
jgi:hypothetical protein